jgi:hypothetical protein
MQLYRSDWLTDTQRTNISCALNAMQEKSLFMGLSDMPMIRGIETLSSEQVGGSSAKANQSNSSRRSSGVYENSSEYSISTSSFTSSPTNNINTGGVNKNQQLDTKHDTRIVNEAFQVKIDF